MSEKKQESSEAAKRSKPVTGWSAGRKASSERAASGASKDPASNAGKKKPRRAAPKIGAKKRKKATAAKKSPSVKPARKLAPGSGKARNGKDAETPPMAEETSNIMADPNENQAERRTAGEVDSACHVETAARPTNQAIAKPDSGVPDSGVPDSGVPDSGVPDSGVPDSGVPDSGVPDGERGKSKPIPRAARKPVADKRVKPGDSGESTPRPNTLVPTNGIHTTERRLKRRLYQNRTVMFLVGATLLGILFIGEQTEPPDMTSVEAQIAAGQTGHARAEAENPIFEPPQTGTSQEPTGAATEAATEAPPDAPPDAQAWDLDGEELVEMERMLARLDLAPSRVDGIVDQQTRHAIRLYQQIAGLPVDGEPSPALLTDMREVVRILDGGGG